MLRATSSPGCYGRVYEQGLHPTANLLRGRAEKPSGPYATYEDFFSALYRTLEIQCVVFGRGEEVAAPTAEILSQFYGALATCTGTQPVYTHVDPHMKNMIIRPIHNEQEDAED